MTQRMMCNSTSSGRRKILALSSGVSLGSLLEETGWRTVDVWRVMEIYMGGDD